MGAWENGSKPGHEIVAEVDGRGRDVEPKLDRDLGGEEDAEGFCDAFGCRRARWARVFL